jgi:hypothetical protein
MNSTIAGTAARPTDSRQPQVWILDVPGQGKMRYLTSKSEEERHAPRLETLCAAFSQ